jgi:hypothetical protein
MYSKLLWSKNEKDKLKDIDGEIDFNSLLMAFSPYAGPIAVTKKIDFEDMIASSITEDNKLFDFKQTLRIYTAIGKSILTPIKVYNIYKISGIIIIKLMD